MAKDLSTQVLIQIRDEITGLRGEVRYLEKRQTETEVRLATELVGVANAVNQVRDELRAMRRLDGQVSNHERRISKLEKRTG